MRRKRLIVILIFSSVLLTSVLYLLSMNKVKEETTPLQKDGTVMTNGERWIQIVRTSETPPEEWYLYDDGDLSGWLEVKTIIEKESLYIATYMGKIHHNRLDY